MPMAPSVAIAASKLPVSPLADTVAVASRGETRTCDVVVVGSGIGGLSCAGLLARYGEDVVVCESHDIAGGAAHGFEIKGYEFDSGPSLFSGLSSKGAQANPLAQVLDALGESVPCIQYDAWMCYLPEGDVLSKIGPDDFKDVLMKLCGPEAVEEWSRLLESIKPLSGAAMALPPAALRADPAVALTVLRFAPALFQTFAQGGPAAALGAGKLMGPFTQLLDDAQIKTPFLRNWCNLLAFLLSGVPADGTIAAEMVYMFGEWYKPGCMLEYPVGGVGALIDALVRGIEKHGGKLSLNSHVETVLVENGKAVGVQLRNGGTLRARKAVVSNASSWDTLKLLPEGSVPAEWRRERAGTPECGSFMHLHLGIDKKDLPEDLGIHHIVVNTWEGGVDGPQNIVLISVPSVLDPSLAPPGKHVLHAYTPGTEPYEIWEGLDRKSPEYRKLKEERSEVLWKAVEKALGPGFDRSKVEVSLIGTPLTHERYLRRHRGSYGPAIRAGQGSFPGPGTPIPGLYCCGDQTFPGIGVPAVAGSGVMVANTLAPVWEHWKLLDAIGL
ncbi:FAD/NAD(P)-binding oxidoreductase family protein [Klebsormidium nitens]|uniref:FAD/NAD(P)-binding oxidoreductase family protein n=1 Tax=Klebsormidium nitens TaxID=105231 RepID=A0A0U9I7I6_KLENI|nr:FAD/NAD(P)-binding oxidoreductase family protein [Klebsormidium nitens]|eukprot:GAQ83842.1 FAD/NAD(P)-binding oxidoreductase family protein [Klebsormidium nitens]